MCKLKGLAVRGLCPFSSSLLAFLWISDDNMIINISFILVYFEDGEATLLLMHSLLDYTMYLVACIRSVSNLIVVSGNRKSE